MNTGGQGKLLWFHLWFLFWRKISPVLVSFNNYMLAPWIITLLGGGVEVWIFGGGSMTRRVTRYAQTNTGCKGKDEPGRHKIWVHKSWHLKGVLYLSYGLAKKNYLCNFFKSCMRETTHLSTNADSSTDTTVGWTKNTPKPKFFEKQKISSIIQKLKNI